MNVGKFALRPDKKILANYRKCTETPTLYRNTAYDIEIYSFVSFKQIFEEKCHLFKYICNTQSKTKTIELIARIVLKNFTTAQMKRKTFGKRV